MSNIIFSSENFKVIRERIESSTKQEGRVKEYILQPNVVIAIPETEDGSVVLVEHKRPILGCTLLECPGGKVDENESLEQSIVRELEEEIGFTPNKLEYISYLFSSVGTSTEKVHFFIASNLIPHKRKKDDILRMDIKIFNKEDILNKINNNEFYDGKSIVALSRYLQIRGILKQTL